MKYTGGDSRGGIGLVGDIRFSLKNISSYKLVCLLPWQDVISLLREHIYDVVGIGVWQTVYAMLRQNSMILQTEILSTETVDLLG